MKEQGPRRVIQEPLCDREVTDFQRICIGPSNRGINWETLVANSLKLAMKQAFSSKNLILYDQSCQMNVFFEDLYFPDKISI